MASGTGCFGVCLISVKAGPCATESRKEFAGRSEPTRGEHSSKVEHEKVLMPGETLGPFAGRLEIPSVRH